VPLEVLVAKFSHTRFEPSGFTTNPDIPIAKSIMDYLFRWLALKYLPVNELPTDQYGHSDSAPPPPPRQMEFRDASAQELAVSRTQSDAPACHECGDIMVRSGACYRCLNCGTTSGCS
jgi:ribonucleoside-diphosphate reductase alpha chain